MTGETTQTPDVGYALATNIASTEFRHLPAEVVEVTKKTILDTLGCILGGSGAGAGIDEVVTLVKEGGGNNESTVFGHGLRTNAWMAAFANGAMAHALDYDNVHDDAFTHPSASTVPAGLAVAERVGNVSGKEFITAVALGDDLHCRLGYALVRAGDFSSQGAWMPPLVLGGFAAAAVGAKLLRLREEKVVDAFGIAFHRTGGSLEIIHDPGPLRGLYAAFPNLTGVLAAVMAHYGVAGTKTCFEGKAGLFDVYFRGVYHRESLTQGLGKAFEGGGVSFKPWPSCRFTHPYVDATLQIVKEHAVKPGDIKEVLVYYEAENVKNCCEPLTARRRPQTPPEAKLSLPFTVAMAIALGKIEIGDFSGERLNETVLLELADKVVHKHAPALKSRSRTMLPALVEIRVRQGATYSKRVDLVYGHPKNPMSWEDLVSKFRDCAYRARKPIPESRVEALVDKVVHLENVSDMHEVFGCLS